MPSFCCLQVIRLENLQWRHLLHSNVPDLYVEVTLGDTTRRTRTVKKSASPVWDEPFTFPYDSVDQLATIDIRVKHDSAWLRDPCVGACEVDPAELLRRCDQGEGCAVVVFFQTPHHSRIDLILAALTLKHPGTCATGSSGRIFLHFKLTGDAAAVSANIGAASEAVRKSNIGHPEGGYEATQLIEDRLGRLGDRAVMHRAFGRLVSKIDAFRPIIDILSELHPFLTVAWKLACDLFDAVKGVFETDRRVVGLVDVMGDAFAFVDDMELLAAKVTAVRQPIAALLRQTIECCVFVREYVRCGFLKRMLDQDRAKVDEFEQTLASLKRQIESRLNISAAFVSIRSGERIDNMLLKQRLSPILSYSFNRPQCLSGTRMAIRERILEWIFSDERRNVFWLHGVAGSGKSTVSMTLMEQLRDMSRLGAFLFNEREKSDPSTVIASIAYQLASFDSSIQMAILSETDKDKDIITAPANYQFDKLILRPLHSTVDLITGPVVIILDALDECGTSTSRRALMDLIRDEFPKLPISFRFLITSRREADIDELLSSQPQNVLAVELGHSSQASREDVIRYIRTGMDTAVRKVVKIPSEWPWDENMVSLGRAADGLFIWVSTVMKMVTDSDNPFDQLECLVSDSRSLGGFGLGQLYSTVLRDSGISWGNKKSRDRFVKVSSLLLLSKVPLTTEGIDGLLGFPPQETSLLVLSRLRSVLTYTPGGSVDLFHVSFADYLVSPEHRDDPWFIEPSVAKRNVVCRCFTVMKDLLRFNICDVKTSFSRNDADLGLADRIQTRIPSHLEYACLYWSQHLLDVDCYAEVVKGLSNFMYNRLLFWLEVLSLKKQFGRIAVQALRHVASWVGAQDKDLSLFLREASMLASMFALPIMESVPHIYVSMIPLAKDDSIVSAHYSQRVRSIVGIERKGLKGPAVCLKVLTGHSFVVNAVSVSPDGRRIVSASWDETIRVWDMDSGQETLQPCIKHSYDVTSVGFFPDSRRFVSGASSYVIVWDAENGDIVLGPLKGHARDFVNSVAVSRDGSMIASGSNDKTIIIWDASDGRIMLRLAGHTDRVFSVSFSPDGTRLASTSLDETVRIWSVHSGEQILPPFVHENFVRSIALSPDGSSVASGCGNKVIIWDATEGSIISVLGGHTDAVTSVAYSPCGTRIVSGSADKNIIIWDAISGAIVSGQFKGHSDTINCVTLSPDGKYIVSGSDDNTLRIWDAAAITASTSTTQEQRIGRTTHVAISVDASRIASASDDNSIIIWDTLTGRATVNCLVGHSEPLLGVAFTPDSLQLISGSWDGVRIWDVETGHLLRSLERDTGVISCMAVSPDGTSVATQTWDAEIRVWNVATGALIAGPLREISRRALTLAYSSDGKQLASVLFDEGVIIWVTDTWEMVFRLTGNRFGVAECACFSPDISLLAIGTIMSTVLIRDVRSGQDIGGPLKGHPGPVDAVVFFLDGLHVVSGSWIGMIRVWEIESGQTILTLDGHFQRVSSLALSSDGTRLVSGSEDSTVRVWDVSDLGTSRDIESTASPTSCRACVSDWVLGDDGWLRPRGDAEVMNASLGGYGASYNCDDSDGRDGNLLLWIPPDLRSTLWRPRNTLIFSCEFSTKVDFTDAAIGERWSECFRS